MSAPATNAPPGPSPTWEFTPEQNIVLSRLASRMRFVGLALIALATILVLWSVFGSGQGDMVALQVALVLGLIGLWSVRGAAAFSSVARTAGSDVPQLMRALGELAKLYELQYWVFLAAALLLGVTVLVSMTHASWLPAAW